MPEYLIHTFITLLVMPIIMFFFVRLVNRADHHKDKEETQWRRQVMSRFEAIENKLSSYCNQNRHEHKQLYDMAHANSANIKAIQTVQRKQGCDGPNVQ